MLKKVFWVLDRAEECSLFVILIAATIVLFANIFLRYVFSAGFHWAEEFVRYAIMWMVFIGSSTCVRRSEHLSVSAITDRLSGKSKKVVMTVVNLIALAFAIFLSYYGTMLTLKIGHSGQMTPSLEIPKYLIYLSIPVAGVLMTVRYIQEIYLSWTNSEEGQ
jgi:C4-dicarboxylate transporter DctQ subunit